MEVYESLWEDLEAPPLFGQTLRIAPPFLQHRPWVELGIIGAISSNVGLGMCDHCDGVCNECGHMPKPMLLSLAPHFLHWVCRAVSGCQVAVFVADDMEFWGLGFQPLRPALRRAADTQVLHSLQRFPLRTHVWTYFSAHACLKRANTLSSFSLENPWTLVFSDRQGFTHLLGVLRALPDILAEGREDAAAPLSPSLSLSCI